MIPPLIGFFAKVLVLYSAIQSGYFFMAIIAIITSVISAYYYLRIIKVIYTESTHIPAVTPSIEGLPVAKEEEKIEENKKEVVMVTTVDRINSKIATPPSLYHSFLISTLTTLILFFFICQFLILNSTQLLSLSIFLF